MNEALLIVDMQNDFAEADGVMNTSCAERIIPNIVKLARSARKAEIPIVHVIQEHRRQKVDYGLELLSSPEHCVEGTRGAKIVDEIAAEMTEESDCIVIKRRFSGFLATDLDLLLRGLNVGKVYLTGTTAEGCVRATAVDAFQMGYLVSIVADCVAAINDRAFNEVIDFFNRRPGGVVWSKDISW